MNYEISSIFGFGIQSSRISAFSKPRRRDCQITRLEGQEARVA